MTWAVLQVKLDLESGAGLKAQCTIRKVCHSHEIAKSEANRLASLKHNLRSGRPAQLFAVPVESALVALNSGSFEVSELYAAVVVDMTATGRAFFLQPRVVGVFHTRERAEEASALGGAGSAVIVVPHYSGTLDGI